MLTTVAFVNLTIRLFSFLQYSYGHGKPACFLVFSTNFPSACVKSFFELYLLPSENDFVGPHIELDDDRSVSDVTGNPDSVDCVDEKAHLLLVLRCEHRKDLHYLSLDVFLRSFF